jgi:DNA repair exonuclease SbcCD ATPase subunit
VAVTNAKLEDRALRILRDIGGVDRARGAELLAKAQGSVKLALMMALTGLDGQRFLRSVLLAQGQFAAFLKARPNERAELLEKITGTEIYSDLSMLAFETYREKEERVKQLKASVGAVALPGHSAAQAAALAALRLYTVTWCPARARCPAMG